MTHRDESFDATVDTLLSSQHRGAALVKAAAGREATVPEMFTYIRRLVCHARDRRAARRFAERWDKDIWVVHVTGTKGKGSTCAFLEGLLQGQGHVTGTFTSPHLVSKSRPGLRLTLACARASFKARHRRRSFPVTPLAPLASLTCLSPHCPCSSLKVSVTERFRVAGMPVRNAAFVEAFWEVWDALHVAYTVAEAAAAAEAASAVKASAGAETGAETGGSPGDAAGDVLDAVPGFFRMVTLVGLWLFAKHGVDVAIMEVRAPGVCSSCVPLLVELKGVRSAPEPGS